jgi:hypothetical protein
MEGLGRESRVSDPVAGENLQMPIAAACELATECWRLSRLNKASFLYTNDRLVLERSVRRLNETLDRVGVRLVDIAGTTYDPGIAAEVLDVQVDSSLPSDTSVVEETVLPTVMCNGKVVQAGQIVVRKAPARQENAGDAV